MYNAFCIACCGGWVRRSGEKGDIQTEITGYICGTRGSRPVSGPEYEEFGGGTSCYVVKGGDHAVVLDCGSGLSRAAALLEGCRKVDVLVTHLHYDHLLGLLDWQVFPKGVRPTFYSTVPEPWLAGFLHPPYWPIGPGEAEEVTVTWGEEIDLEDGFRATFFPANHPGESSVIRLDTAGKTLCLLADYEHGKELPGGLLEGCDILLYDGMFSDEEYPARAGWGHSTWQEGCRLAKTIGVGQFFITHHDTARTDEELRAMETQARELEPSARFARVGDSFSL